MTKSKTPIYNLDIDLALQALRSSRRGLTTHEAQQRRAEFGPNSLPVHKPPLWKRIIEPFASVFVGVLLIALVLSIVEGHPSDAVIIAIIVSINAMIYYAQQYSVDKALKSLQNHDVTLVPVLRDGQISHLPSEELAYGDIVHISEGMKIPADGRLIESTQLECDEAILTGESLPLHKHSGAVSGEQPVYSQRNMVFKGTYAHSGNGLMVVAGIGLDTELGKITSLATQSEAAKTPIERKIDHLMRWLIIAISIAALLTLLLAMFRGVAWEEAVRFALVIVVSAIPEGLPVALTVVLLLSARRMAKANALVKQMASIETMGAVTLIATDKTGTITENSLSVTGKFTTHPTTSTFDQVVQASINLHNGHLSDPLDRLLFENLDGRARLPGSWRKVHDFAFNQSLRLSGVLWEREHDYLLVIKGAPESILEHCLHKHRQDASINEALSEFTNNGYRTIAVAHRSFSQPPSKLDHHLLHDLGFDGFVGLSDRIRPGVDHAVAEAKNAGIRVVMLTGDHVLTAKYIAAQVGIASTDSEVADSSVLQSGNKDEVRGSLRTIKVFGRVLPEHKYALLQATKGHEITAMTGDGVNDIPALIEADAGISLGSSSEAARDASDIVILDSNFQTIVSAIRIGRTALANIRKMIVYLLGTSMGEVMTMITSLLLGMPLPVAAVQILWINLVTDGATVIPLGLSPPEDRQMNTPPRLPSAPLLDFRQLSRVLVMAIAMSASVLVIYSFNLHHGYQYAQTLAFLGLIVAQWANALNANFEYKSWVRIFVKPNYKLLAAIGGSALLQLIIFTTPLGQPLGVVSVGALDALVAAAIPALAVWLAVDLHKLAFRQKS